MGIAGVYPGNCFMRVLTPADVTVERLLGGNGNPTWEQVAQAAGWNRGAIAGVDCSVNVAVGADLEFDIPGLSGYNAQGRVTPTFVRFPYDIVGGCVRILSRVGGTKGTENWEVLLPARDEEMPFVVEEFERFAGNNSFIR